MVDWTRLRILLFFPLVLLALWACEAQQQPVLVVAVDDALTEQPIAGADCRLLETITQTDRLGQCRFASWTVEDTVRVSAAGYQPDEIALAGLRVPREQAEVKTMLSLFPDRVEGTVLDGYTGEPIAAALVDDGKETVRTDASGHFVVLTPTFPVDLVVHAAGYEPAGGRFQTTQVELSLRPNTLEGQILDRYSGESITGAVVTLAASPPVTTTTGEDGRYRFEEVPEAFDLQVEAPRYRPEAVSLERTTYHDLSLRPTFLEGLVRGGDDGRPVARARVLWDGDYLHTDKAGRFLLQDVPEEITLQVLSPGFAKQVLTVRETASVTIDLQPFAVQGIYITSFVASTTDWFTELLDFVAETELNAVVIEAKDAFGAVAYDSQVPLVRELETASPRYDVAKVLQQCRERGIYTIAYIVTFEDSRLADARPEWAVQSVSRGGPWQDRKGLRWTDPYRREVWAYNIAIARELAQLGFDEVQFDYIRFPTDGSISDVRYAEETSVEKQYDAITGFVREAYDELAPTGAFISADVFGYAAWRKMWEQGQDLSQMTHYLDYICPMSYPSHYTPGELGCANPNACPYEIVLETLERAQAQMAEGQRARLRPWVQDFDLGDPPYGPVQVEAQIRAAWDGGAAGWCLWNAGNVYTTGVDYSPQ